MSEYLGTLDHKKGVYNTMVTNPRGKPAERLRAKRIEKGLTQRALGEAIGKSEILIREWEIGRKNFNGAAVSTVIKLAAVLGCTVEDLIDKEEHV